MAQTARKEEPLVDEQKPEAGIGKIIDAIRLFGDRAVLLRRLETEDHASLQRFQKEAEKWRANVDQWRAALEAIAAEKRNIDDLDQAIEKWRLKSDVRRAAHRAIVEMVQSLVPTVVSATDKPEDFVRKVLAYVTRPLERDAQLAVDVHVALEELAADMDPSNQPAGDPVGAADDIDAWFDRASSC